jgi:hypothetical protein
MVFLGERYWSETLPVRPLLEALAGERKYGDYLAFVDSPVEALDFVRAHPPV